MTTTTIPRQRPFMTVDVFTARPYLGNPLAVVLDATDLDDARMQAFAAWTQLSETTFLLPPTEAGLAGGADYRVRIFTPGGELPFAGHPTLGSCHAWLSQGGRPRQNGRIVQECAKGLVAIERQGERLAFEAPATDIGAVEPGLLADVAQALGVQPDQIRRAAWLDNGPRWMGVLLEHPDQVLGLEPDHGRLKALNTKVGACALYDTVDDAPALIGRSSREARAFATGQRQAEAAPRLEVRGFASPVGVNEDPVTGSLNASLALWLRGQGLLHPPYIASQGCCVGRDGRVHVGEDGQGALWIGGDVVECVRGQVLL
ncbi:MAG: PhzF family phenazine biosynthesis protein [Burkholderiaceae bacterium]|jgi:PhzF family phenazine biosynthesis protein|nr:PhzF family phenazine biosynthesis protein [Burkholderiaceae bacterium]